MSAGKFDEAFAKKALVEILLAAKILNQRELVSLCSKVDGVVDTMDSNVSTLSSTPSSTPKASDSEGSSSGKNHAYRFSFVENALPDTKKTSTWGFKPSRKSIFGLGFSEGRDYEDVINEDILKAPVCDICFVMRSDPIPTGFYRIAKTPGNHKANFNSGAGGKTLYLCIKKDLTGDQVPIVNLIVIFPDKDEIVPPGFFVVKRGSVSCNVNMGTNSERIYICYKKDKWGNPITDIQMIFVGKDEIVPQSFNLIETTASDMVADLNAGNGGKRTTRTLPQ